MAVYVISDIHGHARALDRVLNLVSPLADDELYVLGDMVDRGPDPVSVLRTLHAMPCAHVLMGNHERMLLDVLLNTDQIDNVTWAFNGGFATAAGLDALDREEFAELIEWIASLSLFEVVDTPDRRYLLAHAGIDALELRGFLATAGCGVTETSGAADASRELLLEGLGCQDPDTLLWTREGFWGEPTGLVGSDGAGPIVVAGHTPSISLQRYAGLEEGAGCDEGGRGIVVRLGACEETGWVPDRIDIDCSAAAGAPRGRVGIMRLDDGACWYAPVQEGE